MAPAWPPALGRGRCQCSWKSRSCWEFVESRRGDSNPRPLHYERLVGLGGRDASCQGDCEAAAKPMALRTGHGGSVARWTPPWDPIGTPPLVAEGIARSIDGRARAPRFPDPTVGRRCPGTEHANRLHLVAGHPGPPLAVGERALRNVATAHLPDAEQTKVSMPRNVVDPTNSLEGPAIPAQVVIAGETEFDLDAFSATADDVFDEHRGSPLALHTRALAPRRRPQPRLMPFARDEPHEREATHNDAGDYAQGWLSAARDVGCRPLQKRPASTFGAS